MSAASEAGGPSPSAGPGVGPAAGPVAGPDVAPALRVPSRADHEVVRELGAEVYEVAVTQGWIDAADRDFLPGSTRRSALLLLVDLGLLTFDSQAERYHPVDPSAASDLLVAPLAQHASELIAESARWNSTFEELASLYRSSPINLKRASTEIRGIDAINRFIDTQVTNLRVEMLTAQPYGRRPAVTLAEAEPRDMQALRRGVSIRTIYQHSARQSAATREYVAEVSSLGAEVRTSDEFFKRMLVFDRHTALIPATESHEVAVAIHEKSILAFLLDLFDRAWERAMPFTVDTMAAARNVAAEVRSMTLRMLVEGHSDAASAKRLGVSVRTYASYISMLKEEYGVETRFQLGWAMSRSAAPASD
ncbi:LuxR family transcriptional regulator [Nocardioides sp. HDW12B]|uniref:LuxR family transcriptional regulator n=1 Tax=Nocardioides sp. HDW12B TaxID=2714939 RepID=UPI00140D4A05|nr:LuxR family transcriptional regulator [Nocardioides sp. HDW12B]QIK68090.1 LuxR family transcriptional regulator [Nocardioides sp. HDW12B]